MAAIIPSANLTSAAPSPLSEDAIIRTRLLVDSRPLKKCLRRFYLLHASLPPPGRGSPESRMQINQLVVQFLADLAQFEAGLQKYQLLYESNRREVDMYGEEVSRIESEIQKAQEDIVTLKVQLEEAQQRRRNRSEYDVIARQINKLPSRATSTLQISQLKLEIEKLNAEQRTLDSAKELRRGQLQVFVNTIYGMQSAINEAKEKAEEEHAANLLSGLDSTMAATPVEEEEEGVLIEEPRDPMDLS